MPDAALRITTTAEDRAAADMDRLADKLDKVGAAAERASKRGGGLGNVLGGAVSIAGGIGIFNAVSGAIQGVGDAFGSLVGRGIEMNASMEKATSQFKTLMGDADAAKAHVSELFQFAATTPFESGPVIEASRQLRVFGGAALDTEDMLNRIGDSAAAAGQPINEIAFWVGRAYTQIQAGRPFGEAAQRLQEMGILSGGARNEMERLQETGAEGKKIWALLTGELDKTKGAMKDQQGQWEQLTSTFSDTLGILSGQAGAPIFETLKEGLTGINAVLAAPATAEGAARLANGIGAVIGIIRDEAIPAAGEFAARFGAGGGGIIDTILTVGQVVDAFIRQAGAQWSFWTGLIADASATAGIALFKIADGFNSVGTIMGRVLAGDFAGAAKAAGEFGVRQDKINSAILDSLGRMKDDAGKSLGSYVSAWNDAGQDMDTIRAAFAKPIPAPAQALAKKGGVGPEFGPQPVDMAKLQEYNDKVAESVAKEVDIKADAAKRETGIRADFYERIGEMDENMLRHEADIARQREGIATNLAERRKDIEAAAADATEQAREREAKSEEDSARKRQGVIDDLARSEQNARSGLASRIAEIDRSLDLDAQKRAEERAARSSSLQDDIAKVEAGGADKRLDIEKRYGESMSKAGETLTDKLAELERRRVDARQAANDKIRAATDAFNQAEYKTADEAAAAHKYTNEEIMAQLQKRIALAGPGGNKAAENELRRLEALRAAAGAKAGVEAQKDLSGKLTGIDRDEATARADADKARAKAAADRQQALTELSADTVARIAELRKRNAQEEAEADAKDKRERKRIEDAAAYDKGKETDRTNHAIAEAQRESKEKIAEIDRTDKEREAAYQKDLDRIAAKADADRIDAAKNASDSLTEIARREKEDIGDYLKDRTKLETDANEKILDNYGREVDALGDVAKARAKLKAPGAGKAPTPAATAAMLADYKQVLGAPTAGGAGGRAPGLGGAGAGGTIINVQQVIVENPKSIDEFVDALVALG